MSRLCYILGKDLPTTIYFIAQEVIYKNYLHENFGDPEKI